MDNCNKISDFVIPFRDFKIPGWWYGTLPQSVYGVMVHDPQLLPAIGLNLSLKTPENTSKALLAISDLLWQYSMKTWAELLFPFDITVFAPKARTPIPPAERVFSYPAIGAYRLLGVK